MSGQLVGEVLDAAEAGRLPGLKQGELLALVAIAEKCHSDTRRGSVRLKRIRAVIGQSERTTQRIVQRLRDAGHVTVVKRGFKAHGSKFATAPVYELAPIELSPPEVAETPPSAPATLDGGSSPGSFRQNDGQLPPNPAPASATQGGTHDGSVYDGSPYDGGASRPAGARAREAADVAADLIEPHAIGHPERIRKQLHSQVVGLLNEGQEHEVIRDALCLWTEQPDAGPGLLPSLCTVAIKTRIQRQKQAAFLASLDADVPS